MLVRFKVRRICGRYCKIETGPKVQSALLDGVHSVIVWLRLHPIMGVEMLGSGRVVRVHNLATTPTRRESSNHKQSSQAKSDKQLSAYHKSDTASQMETSFTTSANSSSVLVSRCLNHTRTRAL